MNLQVLICASDLQAAQLLQAPHSKLRGLNTTIQPHMMFPNAEQYCSICDCRPATEDLQVFKCSLPHTPGRSGLAAPITKYFCSDALHSEKHLTCHESEFE